MIKLDESDLRPVNLFFMEYKWARGTLCEVGENPYTHVYLYTLQSLSSGYGLFFRPTLLRMRALY